MGKKYALLAAMLLAAVILSYFAYSYIYVLDDLPDRLFDGTERASDLFDAYFLTNRYPLTNITEVVTDAQDNIYVIDNTRTRISKLNSEGVVQYNIRIPVSLTSGIKLFSHMALDDAGTLYVIKESLDKNGLYVESSTIEKYDGQGGFAGVLYKEAYSPKSCMGRYGEIKSLWVGDDALYFFKQSGGFLSKVRLDPNDNRTSRVFLSMLPEDSYISYIEGRDLNHIFYSSRKGYIYRLEQPGRSSLAFPGEGRSIPINLELAPDGSVYFVDYGNKEVRRLTASQGETGYGAETVLTNGQLVLKDLSSQDREMTDVHIKQDGRLLVSTTDKLLEISSGGEIIKAIDGGEYHKDIMLYRWLVLLALLAAFLLLAAAVLYFYLGIMKRRMSLIVKQVIVFVPIILTAMAFITGMVYSRFSERIENEVFSRLALTAKLVSKNIDGDRVDRIKAPSDYMGEDYIALWNIVSQTFEGSSNSFEEQYGVIYKVENDRLFTVMYAAGDDFTPYYPYIDYAGSMYEEAVKTGKVLTSIIRDNTGTWMYGIAPIYDSGGNAVGLYETGLDMKSFNAYKQDLSGDIIRNIILITLAILVIFLTMTYYILNSISLLRKGVNEVASGNWDTVVSINTRDEVKDLSDVFNNMSVHIQRYIKEITEMSKYYYKFVPQQFINALGKDKITDIKLGDSVKQDMNILFADIRHFYLFSKDMTSEGNFNFINSFFKEICPAINENNGLINRYLSAGVQALFEGKRGDALNSAVEMQKRLKEYNKEIGAQGYKPIEVGIGIHKGPLMLGIVGEESRLQSAVISDEAELAQKLEGLTEKLGAAILISEKAIKAIPGKIKHQHRYVGRLSMEGYGREINVYDVFQGDNDLARQLKASTKAAFEQGVLYYQEGRFFDAREKFLEVIKQNRKDEAAKIYFYLCDEYFKSGTPEGWNGILIL